MPAGSRNLYCLCFILFTLKRYLFAFTLFTLAPCMVLFTHFFVPTDVNAATTFDSEGVY